MKKKAHKGPTRRNEVSRISSHLGKRPPILPEEQHLIGVPPRIHKQNNVLQCGKKKEKKKTLGFIPRNLSGAEKPNQCTFRTLKEKKGGGGSKIRTQLKSKNNGHQSKEQGGNKGGDKKKPKPS